MNSKIMIIAGFDQSLILFRRELIESWLNAGHAVVAAAPGRTVKGVLEEMGVGYHELPLERTGLNPLKDIKLFFKLLQIFRREKPDRLFLYTIKPVIYGSLATFFMPRLRIYSMITGLGYVFIEGSEGGRFLKQLVVFLYKTALKRNSRVFFQNPDDIAEFEQLGIVQPGKVVRVYGSGINLERFKQAPCRERPVTFLLIGRLLREKGIFEYVEAAKKVKVRYPDAVFKMIGWDLGSSPSALRRDELQKWREEGIVEILDETDDVRPFLEACSVYVLPSYREGTPRTVLEAMAVGRPVITSDAPGCLETVKEGVNGFLVPVRDIDALAETMEKFIEEPTLIRQMGRESRKLAEDKFDVHKVNEVINRVMGL